MSLEQQIMAEMKDAMKAKNEGVLRSLRAIKAEIIKAKTEPGAGGEIDTATEQKFLQKMMKQRRDSLEIFEKQGREDLAVKEKEEMAVIEKFLPKQLTETELKEMVKKIITETGEVLSGRILLINIFNNTHSTISVKNNPRNHDIKDVKQ